MNINFQDLPSPVKLIAAMDKHPVGARLFLVAMLMCLVAAVIFAFIWVHLR
jgi:type VI protein secretion system component VasF